MRLQFDHRPYLQGYVSAAQLTAYLQRFARDCASRGLWLYPCGTWERSLYDSRTFDGTTVGQFQDYLGKFLDALDDEPNVLGYDLVQEIDHVGDWPYLNRASWFSTALSKTTKPITCSFIGVSSGPLNWANGASIIADGATFADYHAYYLPSISDIDPILTNANNAPAIIGEIGLSVIGNASTGGFTGDGTGATNVSTFWDRVVGWASKRKCQCLGYWSVIDYYSGGLWGLYTITQNGSFVFTTPKTTPVAKWATIPDEIQPYNAGDDAFAVVESPPSVDWTSDTAATVTWTAAVGGTGTKTYTLEYVPVDVNGFPTASWTASTPTTGFSTSVSGLTAAQAYAFRVAVSSESA